MSHSRLNVNAILTALALLVTLGCGNRSDSEGDSPASGTAAQGGEGDAEAKFSSPEATFETAKAAIRNEDYDGFWECWTKDGQDTLAVGMVFIGRFFRAIKEKELESKFAEEAAELRSKLERFTAILDKHGASDAPEIHLQANGDDEANRKELLKLIQPIKDRKAFTIEMLALFTEISDQPDPKLLQDNAELVDLAVNGDTATAKLVQAGQSRTRETPIEFHKVEGKWKIAEAEKLLN